MFRYYQSDVNIMSKQLFYALKDEFDAGKREAKTVVQKVPMERHPEFTVSVRVSTRPLHFGYCTELLASVELGGKVVFSKGDVAPGYFRYKRELDAVLKDCIGEFICYINAIERGERPSFFVSGYGGGLSEAIASARITQTLTNYIRDRQSVLCGANICSVKDSEFVR